jgi:4-hydroxy-4-methyl-2-oxoglutarate aldolase
MTTTEPPAQMAWIDYLKSVDSPTLSNAIELLKIRPRREGFAPIQIRALFPEFGRMCGFAVTAQVETVTQMEPFNVEGFVQLYRAIEQSPKPAVVAVQEIGGFPDYAAHCGEVMASMMTRVGAIGLISDCAVRDMAEVRALRFHYFARGMVASHASFRVVRVGVPVQILGMAISPGDLLHGDENGLLSIPAGLEDKLPGLVDAIRSRERALIDFVRSDQCSAERLLEYLTKMRVAD